ncbi:cyclic nucleotide-binding domain-containing protein [Candidatus Peregrinibacteria bacterium]|nr:cyclic nucleotide-binding domain-containing protein [Candidatus Peregrinibacteria bacterium]MBI3816529.1 cyclic nucleotide-binding domain-containing protein [Candidatus Peregrinibacteria bacterium]
MLRYLRAHPQHRDKLSLVHGAAGTQIIQKGVKPGDVYLLCRGHLDICPEPKVPVIRLSAPSIVGEMSHGSGSTNAFVSVSADTVGGPGGKSDQPTGADLICIPSTVYRAMDNRMQTMANTTRVIRDKRTLYAELFSNADPFEDSDRQEMAQVIKTASEPEKTLLGIILDQYGRLKVKEITGVDDIQLHAKKKRFGKDEMLIGETSEPSVTHECYVILSGEVAIHKVNPEGGSVFRGKRGPGSLIGEMAILDKQGARSASVYADEPTTTLMIGPKFLKHLLTIPAFREAIDTLRAAREQELASALSNPPSDAVRTFKQRMAPPDPSKALETLMESIQQADEEKRHVTIVTCIRKFNETQPPLPDRAWTILMRFPKVVVMFDGEGKLKHQVLTKDNARDVLGHVKVRTYVPPSERTTQSSGKQPRPTGYELRLECMRRGQDPLNPTYRPILSHEALTWGLTPSLGDEDFLSYIVDRNQWIPQRLLLQDLIEEEALKHAKDLSDRLEEGRKNMKLSEGPMLILMKGNTAAGKTRTIRSGIPALADLNILDKEGRPTGVINPDELKNPLREEAKLNGKHKISHNQVFAEGGGLGFNVIEKAMQRKHHLVIDKRFCTEKEVDDVVGRARRHGYKTVLMIDVDAEGETSINGVYGDVNGKGGRNPEGDDPIVPAEAIIGGFRDTRAHRRRIIEKLQQENAKTDGMRCGYYLFKRDWRAPGPGEGFVPPLRVASLSPTQNAVLHVEPEQQHFTTLCSPVDEAEITRLELLARERVKKPDDKPMISA